MTPTAIFVGIDIATTDCVVACRPDGTSWTAPNDAPGITATVDRVRALAPSLIVLEATGRALLGHASVMPEARNLFKYKILDLSRSRAETR